MADSDQSLQDITVNELFSSGEKCTYEIPIYQRNYAWEDAEIEALISDVFDAQRKAGDYHIGTLVVYDRGDHRYEVIDGQQRLTTVWLILCCLKADIKNQLTYAARRKSEDTLEAILQGKDLKTLKYKDTGIEHGFEVVQKRIEELCPSKEGQEESAARKNYREFWLNKVKIVRYIVPEGTDLNQYFEVMNSRGEQLEMHEIVKAKMMGHLNNGDEQNLFGIIWDACSNMGDYVQKNLEGDPEEKQEESLAYQFFGDKRDQLQQGDFQGLLDGYHKAGKSGDANRETSIRQILSEGEEGERKLPEKEIRSSSFQPIIDFPNFLLIVLKITLILSPGGIPSNFNLALDDKELLNAFFPNEEPNQQKAPNQPAVGVKDFAYNLLRTRFFLDNYMVHHTLEAEMPGSNPWKLQIWRKVGGEAAARNLCLSEDDEKVLEREPSEEVSEDNRTAANKRWLLQNDLVQLLSMFEVTYGARQRKNYLFYCLAYLMQQPQGQEIQLEAYRDFISRLAQSYFDNVYLNKEQLNARNVPIPDSFDKMILPDLKRSSTPTGKESASTKNAEQRAADFHSIYRLESSQGVPQFVFNYLDYRIWRLYAENVRGTRNAKVQSAFFQCLGCSDFGLNALKTFYFSRVRRSLEHYFAQANVDDITTDAKINCFGNFAMISGDANGKASNDWPLEKRKRYWDDSKKSPTGVGTASPKLWVMMQICEDNDIIGNKQYDRCWLYEDMQRHQKHMVSILTRDLQDFPGLLAAAKAIDEEQVEHGESETV